MILGFAITTTLEVIAVLLLIWGFLNEKKFVAFENKLVRAIGINIRNHRRRKAAQLRCAEINAARQAIKAVPFNPPEVPELLIECQTELKVCPVWVA